MGFVTHLEGAIDGARLPKGTLRTTHEGRPILVRYDLDRIRAEVDRDALLRRAPTMWRYRELLPPEDDANVVTLGEGMSPILPAPRLGERLGAPRLLVKDEGQLPTMSFKSRGQSACISMAKELGCEAVVVPTAGNAGGAMAAYAARAGLAAHVFMPRDTPEVNRREAVLCGAVVHLVDGLIDDCGKAAREAAAAAGGAWMDVSTLKEPYRLEGKKTMGFEIAEQLGWRLPDVIVYPTGGGTGLVGMWKAFDELEALGWLEDTKRPRMVAVQSEGCAPIVRAFDAGERFAERFEGAATIASGLRVPAAVGDFLILDAVRASDGVALAVPEDGIRGWMRDVASLEGITLGPEPAACIGATGMLAERGWIRPDDEVLILGCGAAQKYPHLMPDIDGV